MNTAILNPSTQQASKPFNAPKLFTAKRLVNTKNMTQSDWLEVRRQGIGSSDCAAACGLNPYMSMLELWMIKTGRVKQSIEDESSGVAPLYWGKQLEPLVAEYYSMHTNNKVRRINAVLQHPDPDKHFMLANLDYSVVVAMKSKFWTAKQQVSTAQNFGEMEYLYTYCVRCSINLQ